MSTLSLGKDIMYDVPMNIRQAENLPLETLLELRVVDTEKLKHRSAEVLPLPGVAGPKKLTSFLILTIPL